MCWTSFRASAGLDSRKSFVICLALVMMQGCANMPTWSGLSNVQFNKETHADTSQNVGNWKWSQVTPPATVRADMISTAMNTLVVAKHVPEISQSEFQLVSYIGSSVCITHIEGQKIRNLAELMRVTSNHDPLDKVQVDFRCNENGVDTDSAAEIKLQQVEDMILATHANVPVLRFDDGEKQWLQILEGGIQCKVTARVDRQRKLVHLILSMRNCGGEPIVLPTEIRVASGGVPLRCLTTSEVLESLYNNPDMVAPMESDRVSFVAVSSRDDYLLPTNYNRLETALRKSNTTCQYPALFSVLDAPHYPGSALLGDARALTGLLLRQEVVHPGDPERTGWIIFGGEVTDSLEITIDIGSGPKTLEWSISQL